MSFLSTLIQHSIGSLARAIRQEKEIHVYELERKKEDSSYLQMTTVCVENPRDSTKKLLELISEPSKAADR